MPADNRLPILIVEDDAAVRSALAVVFEQDFLTQQAADAEEAVNFLDKQVFAITFVDITLGRGMNGVELLKKIKSTWPKTEVVMVTANADTQLAVQCLADGAYDYLVKPCDAAELKAVARRAGEKFTLSREHEFNVDVAGKWFRPPGEILGQSPAMTALRRSISELSREDGVLLIHGEPGSGKELAARNLHDQGPRNKERFVAVEYAGKPFSLIEEQIFGMRQEDSPGVWREKRGLLDYAFGGTLYLNEISALPSGIISRLLDAAKQRSFTRPGSTRKVPFNVRLLFSSRFTPEALAARGVPEGAFRQTLTITPLRDRPEDIVELLHVFIRRTCEARDLAAPRVSEAFLDAFKAYPFRGNVLELASRTENLVVSSQGKEITLSSLPVDFILEAKARNPGFLRRPFKTAVEEFERQIIQEALLKAQGSMKKTCDILGMHRNSLRVKLKQLKIYSKRRKLMLKPV